MAFLQHFYGGRGVRNGHGQSSAKCWRADGGGRGKWLYAYRALGHPQRTEYSIPKAVVKMLQHALTMLLRMALFKANRNLSQCRSGGWVEITVQCCLVCEALGFNPQPKSPPYPQQKKKEKKKTKNKTKKVCNFCIWCITKISTFLPLQTRPLPPPPHRHTQIWWI